MSSALSLKPYLEQCGYAASLLRTGAQFADRPDVALVGFAHEPADARSACIAALDITGDPLESIRKCRPLGAPIVMAWRAGYLEVYRQSVSAPERAAGPIAPDKLDGFFAENKQEFEPHGLYRLKTRGLLEARTPRQLTFVDVGFMRLVDEEMGQELTRLVERAVDALASAFGARHTIEEGRWILEWAFRLLAGKILRDKGVAKFRGLDLLDYATTSRLVGEHYAAGAARLLLGTAQQRRALAHAADLLARHEHLGRVTTEALADVYESAFVTQKTRKSLGTHSTPSYLADYMIWQLADWIGTIPLDDVRVYEPACGHAAFLVSMMRFLREAHPTLPTGKRSQLYRKRFGGIEIDAFAVEIAKLSLTLADIPNPNGWQGVVQGDMFAGGSAALHKGAANCTVLLGNPPFEKGTTLRVLKETIPNLPVGAVFAFVVPQALIYSPKRSTQDFRRWLIEHAQLREVCAFPQGMFKFSDHESALLLGRRVDARLAALAGVRTSTVRDTGRERFKECYGTTTSQVVPQRRFLAAESASLWVPDLDEIWKQCASMPTLGSIADVGQGLAHKGRYLPAHAVTMSKTRPTQSKGFRRGFKTCLRAGGEVVRINELPDVYWLNLDREVVGCPRTGATTGIPQVLVNYGRVARVGVWRVVAYIDQEGRAVTSRFLTVRPRDASCPLEFLWAVCNSPIASAFVYCHTLKRDNTKGIIERLPVPRATDRDVSRVVEAARRYLDAAARFDGTRETEGPSLFDQDSGPPVNSATLRRLLLAMDAEVLRVYALPAWAERQLLDLFAESRRKGLPFDFGPYYPNGSKATVPLHIYLSQTYQRYLKTGEVEVTAEIRQRYDELIDKRLAGAELTGKEDDDLHRLEAEMDGSDYAAQPLDDSSRTAREAERRQARSSLDEIANTIIDRSQVGGREHAHRP